MNRYTYTDHNKDNRPICVVDAELITDADEKAEKLLKSTGVFKPKQSMISSPSIGCSIEFRIQEEDAIFPLVSRK